MNGLFGKFLTSQVVTRIADESISGCREVVCKFAGNYVKRRNVGFTVIESASGSFRDTRNYYVDVLTGKEPREMYQAIDYDK